MSMKNHTFKSLCRAFALKKGVFYKSGGYCDAKLRKTQEIIKKLEFQKVSRDSFNTPDGSVMRETDQYVLGNFTLSIMESYGDTKWDNRYKIALSEKINP
jgi:hypothetical protein